MENELSQLIYDYIKKKKNINNFFVEESLKIIIKHLHLEEYIKNIKPLIDKSVYARYNRVNKTIYINYQKINEYIQELFKHNFLNSNIPISYKYIIFMQILLHEVMHAKQHKKSTEYSDDENISFLHNEVFHTGIQQSNTRQHDAESIILYEEFNAFENIARDIETSKTGIIKGFIQGARLHKIYKKLYEYSPSERLANIDSTQIAYDIAMKLNDEYTLLLMLLQNHESYLNGYNVGMIQCKSDEPTKYYLNSICHNHKWQDIVTLSSNLSEIDKIRLGLKTNQEELSKIASKAHQLTLTLNKN